MGRSESTLLEAATPSESWRIWTAVPPLLGNTQRPAGGRPSRSAAEEEAREEDREHGSQSPHDPGRAGAATPVEGPRDGQRHCQVINVSSVALHPLPDLTRKGDLHAARKNLESISSHKQCLEHRPTSVNTKTDTDRPKAISVRLRIHDLRWLASHTACAQSLAARHPKKLGTTSKGYTSEFGVCGGPYFFTSFSLMDDSKTSHSQNLHNRIDREARKNNCAICPLSTQCLWQAVALPDTRALKKTPR